MKRQVEESSKSVTHPLSEGTDQLFDVELRLLNAAIYLSQGKEHLEGGHILLWPLFLFALRECLG